MSDQHDSWTSILAMYAGGLALGLGYLLILPLILVLKARQDRADWAPR